MWLTITTIWEADTSICFQEAKNSSLLMILSLSLIWMAIALTQLTLRQFFVGSTTVETNCCPIPNSARWCLSMTLPSQAPSEVAVAATTAALAGLPHRHWELPTVLLLLSPTIQDMRMSNLIESALLVPFPRKTKWKVLQKRTLLFSVGPLVARRRKRPKRKKKVYSAADSDLRCPLLHKERMDLRIHRANKLRRTSMKRKRSKRTARKGFLNSIASLMSLSIKLELTRNLR